MTGAETLGAAFEARPVFRGQLGGQQPRIVGTGIDLWLLLAVLGLVALGTVMVMNVGYFPGQEQYGDEFHFLRKHVISIGLGLVACAVVSRLSSVWLRRLAYPLLGTAVAALAAVLVAGSTHGGAQRWIDVGPLAFQPSEFAKLALILYLAHSLVKKSARVDAFSIGVLPHALVVGLLAVLLLAERDFGSTALLMGLLVVMLFGGGVPARHLVLMALAAAAVLMLAALAEPYRVVRLLAFWNGADPQGAGYHLDQSLLAIGSGGVWGVGLGESRQKMFFLPAAHTDFIFAVIGEELGLMGALLVIGLFGVVGVRGFRIAARHPDEFGGLLAFGVTVLLLLQAGLNVAVVLGCLPTKGLVLPFISFGGSAMLVMLVEVGVLLALAREAR